MKKFPFFVPAFLHNWAVCWPWEWPLFMFPYKHDRVASVHMYISKTAMDSELSQKCLIDVCYSGKRSWQQQTCRIRPLQSSMNGEHLFGEQNIRNKSSHCCLLLLCIISRCHSHTCELAYILIWSEVDCVSCSHSAHCAEQKCICQLKMQYALVY